MLEEPFGKSAASKITTNFHLNFLREGDITKEIWKDIKNYEGLYQVSNLGNVRSLDRVVFNKNGKEIKYKGRQLKPFKSSNKSDYLSVQLNDDHGNRKTCLLHRLVAEAFIPNPENKPEVNHIVPIIKGGKNESTNLEWVTKDENMEKATNLGLFKNNHNNVSSEKRLEGLKKAVLKSAEVNRKPILMLDKDTGATLKEFQSINEACVFLNKSRLAKTDISNVCKGKRITAYGYKWKFK